MKTIAMRVALLTTSVLALGAQSALGSTLPQTQVNTGSTDDDWRDLEYTNKKCATNFYNTVGLSLAQRAIDQLNDKEGTVRFEKPGCQRVACISGYDTVIDVCWEPIESTPEVYEKPYSYIADYATGIKEEWCPKVRAPSTFWVVPSFVGGEVSDPAGLAINLHRDECK